MLLNKVEGQSVVSDLTNENTPPDYTIWQAHYSYYSSSV